MLFRELREGKTLNGKTKLKTSSGSLSTAEAISVGVSAWAEAAHFGDGAIDARSLARNLVGAVVKDPVQDSVALQEYLENVVRIARRLERSLSRHSRGDLEPDGRAAASLRHPAPRAGLGGAAAARARRR